MSQPTREFSFRCFQRALRGINFERAPENFWKHFEPVPHDHDSISGTQSNVGIIRHKEKKSLRCFFKMSLFEDNVIYHEYSVLRALMKGSKNSPHFIRAYGIVDYSCAVDITNPFDSECKARVLRPMLLLEYIPGTEPMADVLDFLEESEYAKVTVLVQQIFAAVRIMRALKITHNDLHCENILIQRCSTAEVLDYSSAPGFSDAPEGARRLETQGYIAIIIDFGYSYAPPVENPTPLYCSYSLVKLGYLCDRFLPFTDYVRALVDFNQLLNGNRTKAARGIRKIFHVVTAKIKGLNLERGWDLERKGERSVLHRFQDEVELVSGKRLILYHEEDWVGNLQSLINHPLQDIGAPRVPAEIKQDIGAFFTEWSKVESEIGDICTLNWLFKQLMQSMRAHRESYLADPDKAVVVVRAEFLAAVELVAKFVSARECDFAELISSLYMMAHCLENYLFAECDARYAFKMRTQFADCPFRADTIDNYMQRALCKYLPVIEA